MQRVALVHLASTTSPIHPAPSAETSPLAALLAQLIEERLERLGVTPGPRPDEVPGVMVDDDHEVLVAFSGVGDAHHLP